MEHRHWLSDKTYSFIGTGDTGGCFTLDLRDTATGEVLQEPMPLQAATVQPQ